MKRVVAMADHSAVLWLKLLAAINVLFLLSFMAVATLASGQARAEMPECTGKDLMASIRTDDPDTFRRIEQEAAATVNGKGLLWKLEKEGRAPSFLFGTMHMTDPRVTSLPPAAQRAFDASQTVVIETTDVVDPARMMAAVMKKPELTMFTDDTTLPSLLSPEDAAVVDAALAKRGIPLASVIKMKPWILATMAVLPACETARKAAGAPVLDVKLAKDAEASGKKLEGLETATEQLEAMASLPMDFHLEGLVETLKLGDRMDDIVETMITLYLRGDMGMYWPLFRAALPDAAGDEAGYAAFEEAMITERNKTMAGKAEPLLAAGNAFIAVGALHLPGPDGLVELFRKAGYTVSPAG
ncbi:MULTISPECIES: TraB/GumN family protein [unclassified Mesorhizobium]|uniref:TraB/GumN family protein n=1 Tax=unclassified Mesorhizobium TaxID=325217 RepID=UPI0019296D22|nr:MULTISPECIES: TraB/GumN family protein [unclassified Mesorhizobium]BCH22238.1 GumN family protein [Mesorhizobium sp. L-8-3]